MFDKLREKWRRNGEAKARKKAVFVAIEGGTTKTLKTALEAVRADGLTTNEKSRALRASIDRQDANLFKELLLFIDNPNTKIEYSVSYGRSVRNYSYSPLGYALMEARTHDIALLLASNPRTHIADDLLQAARNGGMQDVAAVLAKRTAELRRQEAVLLDKEAAHAPEPAPASSAAPAAASTVPVAAPASTLSSLAPGESWALMTKTSIAHVTSAEAIGRKLTEIFNFESRDRVLITENLKTGVESIGQAESFDKLGAGTVGRAEDMLKTLIAEVGAKKSLNL